MPSWFCKSCHGSLTYCFITFYDISQKDEIARSSSYMSLPRASQASFESWQSLVSAVTGVLSYIVDRLVQV